MILLLDNYDSFTYNIVQYLEQLNTSVMVCKNDAITITQIERLRPAAIVLGPGPGTPDKAGLTLACIEHFANKLPLLGVCLGHQAIAQAFGAKIVRAEKVMHGRTSFIQHTNTGLFRGMENPTQFTRYHSLLIDKESLPDSLEITAWTSLPCLSAKTFNKDCDKDEAILEEVFEIMAIRHKYLPVEAVQFHPESILSESGLILFDNFLQTYNLYN